jgi:hypothetical protein
MILALEDQVGWMVIVGYTWILETAMLGGTCGYQYLPFAYHVVRFDR